MHASIGNSIGKKVKHLRELQGLTQLELAKASGLTKAIVFDIENGKNKKTAIEFLEKICGALNITLSEFFEEEAKRHSLDVVQLSDYIEMLTPEERKHLFAFVKSLVNRAKPEVKD